MSAPEFYQHNTSGTLVAVYPDQPCAYWLSPAVAAMTRLANGQWLPGAIPLHWLHSFTRVTTEELRGLAPELIIDGQFSTRDLTVLMHQHRPIRVLSDEKMTQ